MTTGGHRAEPIASAEDIVETSYSYYELLDAEGDPDISPDANDAVNGLVAIGSSGAMILAGTQMGPVRVRLEIYDAEPPRDSGQWEEVAEVRQHTDSGSVSVSAPPSGDQPESLPTFETEPDSDYGIRVHARGREAGRQHVAGPDEPVEVHLIQLWAIAS